MRILVLNAHPDEGSFCDAVAAAYVDGARAAGHEVRGIALRELRFDLVLRGGFHSTKPLEPDIAEQQRRPSGVSVEGSLVEVARRQKRLKHQILGWFRPLGRSGQSRLRRS